MMTAHAALFEAGRTIAALSDSGKDISQFAAEFREIAATLTLIGSGLERADDRAEERYDVLFGQRRYDAARAARTDEIKQAHLSAIRTGRRQLVELSRLVAEMEAAGVLGAPSCGEGR